MGERAAAGRRTEKVVLLLILTWGGLRGGLSIAMALSLPESVPYRGIILLMTYAIVVFSILVQGMTIGKVAGHRTTTGNEYNDPRLDETREEKALPSVIERFLSRASRDTANKK